MSRVEYYLLGAFGLTLVVLLTMFGLALYEAGLMGGTIIVIGVCVLLGECLRYLKVLG